MLHSKIEEILPLLCCPVSKADLEYIPTKKCLYCKEMNVYYPIENGIPLLLREKAIKAEDFPAT